MDLHVIPFKNVYNFSDPNVALSYWIDLFLDVINKHVPLKKKKKKKRRVKQQTLPPWLNTDIKQAMLLRDKCRKQKKFVEYKQQRNRVNYLVKKKPRKNILMTLPEIKQIYHPCGQLSTHSLKATALQTIIFHRNSHQMSLTPTSYL